jgi:hypothetical protein
MSYATDICSRQGYLFGSSGSLSAKNYKFLNKIIFVFSFSNTFKNFSHFNEGDPKICNQKRPKNFSRLTFIFYTSYNG